jgi:hypothetical protein
MKTLIVGIVLLGFYTLAWADAQDSPHMHLGELIGCIGGIIAFFFAVIGFFVRRSVFMEIDELKESKQDKVLCEQPLKDIAYIKETKQDKSMCEQIESVACRDRDEIKEGLKEGIKEFKVLHKKIDRIMWKLKLPPKVGEDRGDGEEEQ